MNLPNQLNQKAIYIFIFFVQSLFLYMSYFVIAWSDGLVVKALECGWEGCGFKPWSIHHKKILILGIQRHMTSANTICQYINFEKNDFFFYIESLEIKGDSVLDSPVIQKY
jgi:hypothetical protein